jgi:hypothetical protein
VEKILYTRLIRNMNTKKIEYDFRLDEATHIYTVDGKPIPNVTTIIEKTVGGGWKAGEWYLQRGKVIHACAAMIAEGKQFNYDERVAGYVQALRRFFDEVKPTDCESEKRVFSGLYWFAGTIDLVCKIGGIRCVVDYKHTLDTKRIGLQLGGYAVAAADSEKYGVFYGYGIEIRENGTYSMTEKIHLGRPRREFLALKATYNIKERCGVL